MNVKRLCAVVLACACISGPAVSATLTITNIEGIWKESVPTVEGAGTSTILWGRPAGSGKSGYRFTPAADDVMAEPDEDFVLGRFTHLNFPVYDASLETVNLEVSFEVEGLATALTSIFSFAHLETVNASALCPDGAANGVGVNASGCADRVTAVLNGARSETFSIGGVTYVLDVTGFLFEGETLSNFWTEEAKENRAELIARFSTDVPQDDPAPPVSPVPLPASGLLLLGGLAGLSRVRRHN